MRKHLMLLEMIDDLSAEAKASWGGLPRWMQFINHIPQTPQDNDSFRLRSPHELSRVCQHEYSQAANVLFITQEGLLSVCRLRRQTFWTAKSLIFSVEAHRHLGALIHSLTLCLSFSFSVSLSVCLSVTTIYAQSRKPLLSFLWTAVFCNKRSRRVLTVFDS